MRQDDVATGIADATVVVQDSMRAIGAAVTALADDPYPAEGFRRGRHHRLRVGTYRVLRVVDADAITIERADRVAGD